MDLNTIHHVFLWLDALVLEATFLAILSIDAYRKIRRELRRRK